MGHGEVITSSPQNHQSSHHYPQVGGPNGKKSHHHHDNSKGSSKASKKSQGHSTTPSPQNQKPNMMGKTRHGHGTMCSPNGMNKANLALQLQQQQYHHHQQQQQHHLMKQHSMPAGGVRQLKAATPRQKSFSPPTLHPMPSGMRTGSPFQSGGNNKPKDKEHFYAGARFETQPSHLDLPVPPSHWTAQIQRSQSQPSSPVPISMPQKGVSVDLATLFGHSTTATDSALKSASFPGERLMGALMKMEDDRKKKERSEKIISNNNATVNFGSPVVTKAQVDDTADELKKALGLAIFTSPVKAAAPIAASTINEVFNSTSHLGSEMSPSKYQDISVQLKNLLKVAA